MFKTIRKSILKWQIRGYKNRKNRIQGRMNVYYSEVNNLCNIISALTYKLKRMG